MDKYSKELMEEEGYSMSSLLKSFLWLKLTECSEVDKDFIIDEFRNYFSIDSSYYSIDNP